MTTAKSRACVIWAVDPLEEEAGPNQRDFGAFLQWMRSQDATLIPVTIAVPSNADLALGYVAPVKDLEQKLDQYLRNLGIPFEPGRVLVEETASKKNAAELLVKLAEKEGAIAIAVSSHGRSGMERMVLGSFVENLLRFSSVPIYFLPRQAQPRQDREKVLFPTDFSENSHKAFQHFLAFAKRSNQRVVLYHSIMLPLPYGTGESFYVSDHYYEEQAEWAKKQAASWLEEARKSGSTIEFISRDGGAGFVTGASILKAAKELGASLIAMASTSGSLERVLFGSAAYDVFQSGSLAVLLYGPYSLAAEAVRADLRARNPAQKREEKSL